MEFECQKEAILQLQECAKTKHRSILIEGMSGVGKTYLASLYKNLVGDVDNFLKVKPVVADLQDAIQDCYRMDESTLLCIENLDLGVSAASYTMLKFLEEPKSNVYVVVTCRDKSAVPDTILSRSICITIGNPVEFDITRYAESKDFAAYNRIPPALRDCVQTFSDVDMLLSLSTEQMNYILGLRDQLQFKDTIQNTVWNLGHYADGSESPIQLVMRYLMNLKKQDLNFQRKAIQCVTDLNRRSIAPHAILSMFVLDCKYGD